MSHHDHKPTDPSRISGDANEVLRVEGLSKHFPIRKGVLGRAAGWVQALDDANLVVKAGQTVAVVGESGSGKTTLGRTMARLVEPTKGRIYFRGQDITALTGKDLRKLRKNIQVVFQNPSAALNPRMTVSQLLSEPLRIHGNPQRYIDSRVPELLELVGLGSHHLARYPHKLSGGQAQRLAIARSLALEPELIIFDEPVSALDVSVQAQIIQLLIQIQQEYALAFVFISHDLSVVQVLADTVAVMYLGKIVEAGSRADIFTNPKHPYTQSLLSAVLSADPAEKTKPRIVLKGDIPSPADPPTGCRFRTRCWKAQDICAQKEPELSAITDDGHTTACHFPSDSPLNRSEEESSPLETAGGKTCRTNL